MTRYDTILFDLDGTLVDSLPGIEYSARAAIAVVCPGAELPSLRAHIGPPIREVFRRALRMDDASTLDDLQAAFRLSYDTEGWVRTQLYVGVDDVLSELARTGRRLMVLTNKPDHAAERILRHLSVRQRFERVVAPSLNAKPAPKREAAVRIAATAGLAPGTALLVGDSLDDAEAAAACGFAFGAVTYGYGAAGLQSQHPVEFRLNHFPELLVQLQYPSLT